MDIQKVTRSSRVWLIVFSVFCWGFCGWAEGRVMPVCQWKDLFRLGLVGHWFSFSMCTRLDNPFICWISYIFTLENFPSNDAHLALIFIRPTTWTSGTPQTSLFQSLASSPNQLPISYCAIFIKSSSSTLIPTHSSILFAPMLS